MQQHLHTRWGRCGQEATTRKGGHHAAGMGMPQPGAHHHGATTQRAKQIATAGARHHLPVPLWATPTRNTDPTPQRAQGRTTAGVRVWRFTPQAGARGHQSRRTRPTGSAGEPHQSLAAQGHHQSATRQPATRGGSTRRPLSQECSTTRCQRTQRGRRGRASVEWGRKREQLDRLPPPSHTHSQPHRHSDLSKPTH